MLDNILYISDPEDYVAVAKDKTLIQALNSAVSKILKKDAVIKEMVMTCENLLADSECSRM